MSNKIDISKGRYWDQSLSPVTGCSPCSPGCSNCWAKEMVGRFQDLHDQSGRAIPFGMIRCHPDRMGHCLRRKEPTVYALSWLGDLFHDDVPVDFISKIFNIMLECYWHTFLVLTKRAKRMRDVLSSNDFIGLDCGHIWLGVTVCNQEEAYEKIPMLLETPAVHRWLSVEPMLGAVNLMVTHGTIGDNGRRVLRQALGDDRLLCACPECQGTRYFQTDPYAIRCCSCEGTGVGIDFVVVGAESGSRRRECKERWIQRIELDCKRSGIPLFVKQIHRGGKLVKAPDGYPQELPEWGKR